jgi:hypothetical protein
MVGTAHQFLKNLYLFSVGADPDVRPVGRVLNPPLLTTISWGAQTWVRPYKTVHTPLTQPSPRSIHPQGGRGK